MTVSPFFLIHWARFSLGVQEKINLSISSPSQAICFPLSNYKWTIHKSHAMVVVAWALSLLLSVPQTVVYTAENTYCIAKWAPNWGSKVIRV